MVLKKGRFGQFYACSGYPDCKTTKQLGAKEQKKADVPLDETCPTCGKNLIKRFGRFGEFVACSGYPKCKYTKQPTIGMKCPKCSDGEIVERNSTSRQDFTAVIDIPSATYDMGQTAAGTVSAMQQSIPCRKVAEVWAGCAMPESRM